MIGFLKRLFMMEEIELKTRQESVSVNHDTRNSTNNNLTKAIDRNIIECNEKKFYQEISESYGYIAISINKFSKQVRLLRDMYGVGSCRVSDKQLVKLFCRVYSGLEKYERLGSIKNYIQSQYLREIFANYFEEINPNGFNNFKGKTDQFVNVFFENNLIGIFMDMFIIDTTSDTYQAIQESLNCMNDNSMDVDTKIGVLCANIIGAIISFVKIIRITKYVSLVYKNEEFIAIANDTSTSVEEKYSIYEEFYIQIINEKLDINDFKVLINIITNYQENAIECIENLYQIIGLDINKLIIETREETLYREFDKIYNTQGFEYLMKDNDMVDLAFVSYVPYFLINKIGMEKWLLTLFEQEDFTKKISIYLKKNEILRKAKTPNIEIIKDRYNNVETGEEFELFLKELYEQIGYEVALTPTTGDQGADLIVEKSGVKTVVQAKFYSSAVGNSAVQEVIGAIGFYKADKGIVITNNLFTKSAKELAQANNIHLIDGNSLVSIIETVM